MGKLIKRSNNPPRPIQRNCYSEHIEHTHQQNRQDPQKETRTTISHGSEDRKLLNIDSLWRRRSLLN